MKNHILLVASLFFCLQLSFGQKKELTYYLPNLAYDKAIPTPEEFLGWQIGEWHVSHDLQQSYMKLLASVSPRMTLTEYGRSYEQRPMIHLTVTSPDNHKNLDELQARHVALSDPSKSKSVKLEGTPLVLYQGFSIHGNEPSGGNAALLLAYYLAAAPDSVIGELLDKTIILFDPCYNPDGFNRFSSWANSHKNKNLTADSQDREYDEAWPRGRTNHYWFDLNRDWLPVQHPESRGRIKAFHAWKPNILTDHHEMGTNATFFFMPGEATRVHPLTPKANQSLTAEIGTYHAAALDQKGSLYYSEEGYDDYYLGKGSTYPDANGCIGILFEQASSRGHLQNSDNGPLSFAFTISNQVTTGLSTYAASVGLKNKILGFQRDFYLDAQKEAANDRRYGYVFGNDNDQGRTNHLIDILLHHQIDIYPLEKDLALESNEFEAKQSYVVPLKQAQYRFIKGLFDPISEFEDSIFYDVSTWTLPMAFNLPCQVLNTAPKMGDQLTTVPTQSTQVPIKSAYAYALPWNEFYAPALAYQLMDAGLRLKVTTESSVVNQQSFGAGTVILPVENQTLNADEIYELVKTSVSETGVQMYGLPTGLSSSGPDLGSRKYYTLQKPTVAILVGGGITSYEAGSNWHLLDQRFGLPVTKLSIDDLSNTNLDIYTTIIMPNGGYRLSSRATENLDNWLKEGGVLVAQKRANNWCIENNMAQLTVKPVSRDKRQKRPYGTIDRDEGGRVLGGAIFNTEVDLSHPLLYGFQRTDMPSFHRGNLFFRPSKNPYATPIRFTNSPLLSGYVHPASLKAISGSANVIVSAKGAGRTISMVDEPTFRAFWFGTSKLLGNAIFFGHIIDVGASEVVK